MKATKITYNVKTKQSHTEDFDFTPPNPRLTEIPERQMEIRTELHQSDHKALQFNEGWITEEEFEPIRLERQALREEYRALESELKSIQE